jgi:hypothetical protein
VILLAWMVAAATAGAFPGSNTRLASPDGFHVVVWEAPRTSDPAFPHHLWLEDLRSGQRLRLMPFTRHVTVEWSPSGRHLAVTCHRGSDFSDIVVFDVERPAKGASVRKELQRRVGRLRVLKNHHAYVEATRWLDDASLEIRLWGYGDQNPKGFDWVYIFELAGEARLVRSGNGLPPRK